MIDQKLGNTFYKCPKDISSLLEAAPELAIGDQCALRVPDCHLTSDVQQFI
jgi:hypothetical protein